MNVFGPDSTPDEHENVGQALVDIIMSDTQVCFVVVVVVFVFVLFCVRFSTALKPIILS